MVECLKPAVFETAYFQEQSSRLTRVRDWGDFQNSGVFKTLVCLRQAVFENRMFSRLPMFETRLFSWDSGVFEAGVCSRRGCVRNGVHSRLTVFKSVVCSRPPVFEAEVCLRMWCVSRLGRVWKCGVFENRRKRMCVVHKAKWTKGLKYWSTPPSTADNVKAGKKPQVQKYRPCNLTVKKLHSCTNVIVSL